MSITRFFRQQLHTLTAARPRRLATASMVFAVGGIALLADPAQALAQSKSPLLPALRQPVSRKFEQVNGIVKAQEAAGPSATERSRGRVAQASGGVASGTRATKCRRRRGTFPWNFEKAKILDVLDQISRLTCRNFIVSGSVKAKTELTIISRRPITVDQAWSAFLAALEANKLALVPAGRFYKVVKRKDSVKQALPIYEDGSKLPGNDSHVTYLHQLQYTSKETVQPLLRNLMSKNGDLQFVGDLMILTDSGSNIRRLIKILDKIDVSGTSSHVHIVDLVYADAQQVSQKLKDVFDGTSTRGVAKKGKAKNGAAESVSIEKIVADERTNKLIIISSKKAYERALELIEVLDVPATGSSSEQTVHVYALNNSDAQKVASTLSSLAQSAQQANRSRSRSKGKKNSKAGGSAALFEGDVKITADESTNSLVIMASSRDFKAMTAVIEKLDVRRPQVFVEAVIMEVSLTDNMDWNFGAFSGYQVDDVGGYGPGFGLVSNPSGKNLITGAATAVATSAVTGNTANSASALSNYLGTLAFQGPAIPGTQDALGFAIPSFGAVLNFLETDTNVNILSTPHLLTTDNEKAEISVGQRVPVVRGAASIGGGTGGFGIPLQQVSYEDVKLTFTITPHVNADNQVRLELEQEVNDIGGQQDVGGGLSQPIITNRSAKTTVVASDQQTLVIGGLIQDRKSENESKVPFLGDLPIIGWLFKSWGNDTTKTNLLIVLTPYIVNDQSDFQRIYERKMKERQEFVDAYSFDAKGYDPHVDYTRKSGPLAALLADVHTELQKAENGGPGRPGETVVTPAFDEDATGAPAADTDTPKGDTAGSEGGA